MLPTQSASEPQSKSRFVRDLFAAVAPTYDLLNTLLSLGLHTGWRRAAARATRVSPGGTALDVATGTADLALELQRRVGPSGRVVGVDFCAPMLALGKRKCDRRQPGLGGTAPSLLLGDALSLPLADGLCDTATIAFGLRNTADVPRCLAEMARAVRPGGTVVILEFALPRLRILRAVYLLYFDHLLPAIGKLVHGKRESYQYLPDSVKRFATREELKRLMQAVGLREVTVRDLALGIVALHVGTKAG
ncbi:MAG TPA: bifunctional demethylmenaquinone methyltransferase/2-methoxy-6-polyprenyl-1,4-benzoquinol methylase UbiE [Armatimonadota bacterium]